MDQINLCELSHFQPTPKTNPSTHQHFSHESHVLLMKNAKESALPACSTFPRGGKREICHRKNERVPAKCLANKAIVNWSPWRLPFPSSGANFLLTGNNFQVNFRRVERGGVHYNATLTVGDEYVKKERKINILNTTWKSHEGFGAKIPVWCVVAGDPVPLMEGKDFRWLEGN